MVASVLQTLAAEPHISLQAEEVLRLGPLSINNSLLAGLTGSLLIIVLFALGTLAIRRSPSSRLGQAVEALCETILDFIEDITHSRAKALRYFPLLTTLFVFILLNNWLGLLPGVGSISITTNEGTAPLFRGANADLNTTLALAIISVVMTQIYAFRELGVK